MDEILILLLLIYALSPIPLLIIMLLRNAAARRAKREAEAKASECADLRKIIENHEKSEEDYRKYVNQLHRKIRELDPDAKLGVLEDTEEDTSSVVSTAPVPVSAGTPDLIPASTQQHPLPVPSTASVKPQPVLPAPKAPAVSSGSAFGSSRDSSHTTLILTAGVIAILLASIGFISATWSRLGIGIRAICLFSFSAVFLGAGVFAKAKLKLQKTSIAFYSIGSAALPITVFGGSAFALFGDAFGLYAPELYNTCLLAFTSLLLLTVVGAVFFRSRVFACAGLISLSLNILTLTRIISFPFSTDVLFLALAASGIVLLAPVIKKIPDRSVFRPFAQVFEIYAIVNMYVMTASAIYQSESNIFSGIFLLALGAVFLIATILRRSTGLLALPSILLLLVGTSQILPFTGIISTASWFLLCGVTCLALFRFAGLPKPLSYTFFAFGLALMILPTPLVYIILLDRADWIFLPFCLVMIIVPTYLSLYMKKPILFASSVLPLVMFFWGSIFHIFGYTTSHHWKQIALTGFIVSLILYLIFSYIPHHKLYTGTSQLLLFITAFYFGADCVSIYDKLYFSVIFTVIMAGLSLINACRTDGLNIRKPLTWKEKAEPSPRLSRDNVPKTITAFRCVYASIWPLILMIYFNLIPHYDHPTKEAIRAASLLVMIGVIFFYLCCRIIRNGAVELISLSYGSSSENRKRPTTSHFVSVWTGFGMFLFFLLNLLLLNNVSFDVYPVLAVLRDLAPIVLPLLFAVLFFRQKHCGREKSSDSALFVFALLGMFTSSFAIICALDIFDMSGITSFYVSNLFILGLFTLAAMIYLLAVQRRSGQDHSVERSGESSWISSLFGRPVSATVRALLIWVLFHVVVLFLIRILDAPLDSYPALPVIVGLLLIGTTVFFLKKFKTVSVISAGLFTLHYVLTIVHYNVEYGISGWVQVLLYMIPVLVLLFALLLRRIKLTKDPLFWSALVSQILVFILVPVTTVQSNLRLAEAAASGPRITRHAHLLRDLFRVLAYPFTQSRLSFIALPGFLLLGLVTMYRSEKKEDRRRALAWILISLSVLAWMPILTLPSLGIMMEQSYLIPTTVFVLLLPWLFPKKETSFGTRFVLTRFIYTCVTMGILALIALISDDLFSLIFFGTVSAILLIGSYLARKKNYLILSAVCLLGTLAYIANRVWGNMAWWIYLFVTGGVLVTIAVRNEIKKRG